MSALSPPPTPKAGESAPTPAQVATIAHRLSRAADLTGILRVSAPQSAVARKRAASIVLDRDGGEGLTHHDRNCPHRAAAAVHVCRVGPAADADRPARGAAHPGRH